MIPKRLGIKFFLKDAVDLQDTFTVFQRWIQEHAVPGLLIDVVDYKHVIDGPGVILISHEGDYGLDLRDGKPGLLYIRKQEWETDDLTGRLQVVAAHALQACIQLEKEELLNKPQFDYSEVEITFFDRLTAPNTADTLAAVQDTLAALLPGEFTVVSDDPRECFGVRIKTDAETLLARLAPVQAN